MDARLGAPAEYAGMQSSVDPGYFRNEVLAGDFFDRDAIEPSVWQVAPVRVNYFAGTEMKWQDTGFLVVSTLAFSSFLHLDSLFQFKTSRYFEEFNDNMLTSRRMTVRCKRLEFAGDTVHCDQIKVCRVLATIHSERWAYFPKVLYSPTPGTSRNSPPLAGTACGAREGIVFMPLV